MHAQATAADYIIVQLDKIVRLKNLKYISRMQSSTRFDVHGKMKVLGEI